MTRGVKGTGPRSRIRPTNPDPKPARKVRATRPSRKVVREAQQKAKAARERRPADLSTEVYEATLAGVAELPDEELADMRKAWDALKHHDPKTRGRMLAWLTDKSAGHSTLEWRFNNATVTPTDGPDAGRVSMRFSPLADKALDVLTGDQPPGAREVAVGPIGYGKRPGPSEREQARARR